MIPRERSGRAALTTTAGTSAARVGSPAVGLAIVESPARHGLASKHVDARPGQAERLLPKGMLFVTASGGGSWPIAVRR